MSRPSPLLLPFLALLFGLMAFGWWLANRPYAADLAMSRAQFNSVSFAPFRPGQSPLAGRFPSAAEVDTDVALLAGRVRALRSYAAIEGAYDTAAIAERHGLKLWQGIWLGSDRAANEREIAHGIELANRYPETIDRVVVGNEVLLRRDLPVQALIAALDRVRAAVRQPVTYADVWEFWQKNPQVADHVDIVTLHFLPYWEDVPTNIDGAVAHIDAICRQMASAFPGKRIAVGEAGWPSRGRWRADAAPSVVNQAIFLRRFVALAQRERLDYNLIEAFDQDWKYRSEGTVGAHWGLWTAARAAKFPLTGAVVENPDWPLDAAVACGLAVLLLAWALAGTPGLRPATQMKLAALAAAAGVALAYAGAETVPDLTDGWVRVAGAGNLAGQTLLALLLLHRAALLLAGARPPPARNGADATATVQALLGLRLKGLRDWRASLLDDLGFVFVWTAAVLQWLLVIDPRYRDFPIPTFAVPVVAVLVRAGLGDLPLGAAGWEECVVGLALAIGAVVGAVQEGMLNRQSLAWSLCTLVLALPLLLRCLRPGHERRSDPALPHDRRTQTL